VWLIFPPQKIAWLPYWYCWWQNLKKKTGQGGPEWHTHSYVSNWTAARQCVSFGTLQCSLLAIWKGQCQCLGSNKWLASVIVSPGSVRARAHGPPKEEKGKEKFISDLGGNCVRFIFQFPYITQRCSFSTLMATCATRGRFVEMFQAVVQKHKSFS
jgi:hypothetical protein